MKKLLGLIGVVLVVLVPHAYADNAADHTALNGKGVSNTLKHFKDCDECSEMVVLPSGKYLMGASEEDTKIIESSDTSPLGKFLASQEPPHRQVEVAVKSFAIAKYDVTREQFSIFAKETHFQGKGCNTLHPDGVDRSAEADWQNPWFKQTDKDPVVCVSWGDAQKYIAWLNTKLPSGHAQYRLPTEAEWEYATRAGTTTPTYWNNPSKQCQFVNAGDQATKTVDLSGYNTHGLDADCNDGYPTTSPVGAFPANPWGLYDMLGNVGQWTEDCGASYSLKSLSADCSKRMARGSGWGSSPSIVRAAERSPVSSTRRTMWLGFRLAIDVN